MHQQKDENIFISTKAEGDIDEPTFITWKNELQKSLPSFWQSMQ
jgi:hypothetical protein